MSVELDEAKRMVNVFYKTLVIKGVGDLLRLKLAKQLAIECVGEIIREKGGKIECPVYYHGKYMGGGNVIGFWKEVIEKIKTL